MFLENRWYVAALSEELGNRPLGRVMLGQPVVFAKLRKQAATGSLASFFDGRRLTDHRKRHQQNGNCCNVNDLAAKRFVSRHLAISRVFKIK